MKNRTYDRLKYLLLTIYPASVVLVEIVFKALGYANAGIVLTIMSGIQAFFGTLLAANSVKYFKDFEYPSTTLDNKLYDVTKWICLVVYPAAVVLTGVVLNAVGYDNTETVMTILSGVQAFLGSVIADSHFNYLNSTEHSQDIWEQLDDLDDSDELEDEF